MSSPSDANNLIYTPANNKFVDALMQDVCRILSVRSESVDDANALEAKMKTNATFFAGIVFDARVVMSHARVQITRVIHANYSHYRIFALILYRFYRMHRMNHRKNWRTRCGCRPARLDHGTQMNCFHGEHFWSHCPI